MFTTPKVFEWVGSDAPRLYWDDPANWARGEAPNQPEAIVVFADSLTKPTTIRIRENTTFAQLWLREAHDLTLDTETGEKLPVSEQPNFYLETAQQFASFFFDVDNRADLRVRRPWILHSCYWNGTHRALGLGRPVPDGARITTVHIDGGLSNYKDPERASLQAIGRVRIQLNGASDFRGPVIAKDFGEIRAMVNGAIPDATPIAVERNGMIYVHTDVVVRAGSFVVDGQQLDPGIYFSDANKHVEHAAEPEIAKALADAQASGGLVGSLPNLVGPGAITVQL